MIQFTPDRAAASLRAANGAGLRAVLAVDRQGYILEENWLFDEAGCREASKFFLQLSGELARLRPLAVAVRAGDTLWGLAQRHLGDPTRWPEIFDRNRNTILTHSRGPDLIHPGTMLIIPSP